MDEKFLKPYDSKETENNIYKLWEKSGFFRPKDGQPLADSKIKKEEVFSIVLPPPNVTGNLHTGHAIMLAIEDIMVRYNRMLGKKTLWVPGTDHAAIATQSKVEKEIYKKEKKNRHDLGREEFLKRVNEYAKNSHDTIVNQTKKMGASLDWSREAFTLDEERGKAVNEAFLQMYNAELIYRKHRIVNWCPKCQSTLSDDEVEHEEQKAKFYTFKYSSDFPIYISTTRPETKLGDTAVAVNPNDKRYKKYIGQEFEIKKFAGGPDLKIKIIADENIDLEFGTGAVGITPAHSHIDYEIAQKNNLPIIKIIDEYAKITNEAGTEYSGLKIKEAREKVLEYLKANGLLEKEEEINNNLSICYRCNSPIEPLPSLQWFVDVNKKFKLKNSKLKGLKTGQDVSLKEIMKNAVESKQIEIIPDRFEKVYYHWIDNLRDWCISRQIWYGHQIPVWYKEEKISLEEKKGWEQDPDTLDTWFSSGLWTFSTLGWPNNTEDLKTFHPTSVLETGYDILFFWVARMILMSGFLLEDVPFKKVYLHGLVRDEKGRKMSKSLDNAIDPIGAIEKYGADALRMAMIIGVGPGNDTVITDEKIKAYKHFANKIWNASRFVFSNTEDFDYEEKTEILDTDKKYVDELNEILKDITKDMNGFKFYLAGEKLYHYFWHRFADVIIEETKLRLKSTDKKEKLSAQWTIIYILKTCLKTLHPFMPFITEEIWQNAPWNKNKEILMIEKWPKI
ncbi:MAG: valyl-tRNA synthetase [Parcubacteria group bacterium Athens0714_16]|nr:MAG: valyl-tRNA synthetase [Parcubacteria group bacterium Athens0714_16]